jgi:biofilm PGA synthesis N-glycosyltransferase PgaC
MTDALYSFLLFWAIWLLVPIAIDGTTAIAYFIGVWRSERYKIRQRLGLELDFYPMVTIIIPVHNGAPYLQKCIESIRNQSYPHEKIEVFVIDNLSNDGTFQVFAEEQLKPFGGILNWISVPQKGKAYALNAGVHIGRGEYVANIDCDAVLDKDAVFNMIKAFVADEELAAATGSVEILPRKNDNGSDPLHYLMAECEFTEYFTSFHIGRQYQSNTDSLFTLAGAYSMFRRSILLQTFLYDQQTVSEDTKLTFELHKKFSNLKKICVGEAIVYTEPTPTASAFYSQRVRWQRGQLEVASLFPEFIRTPFRLRGLASSKSLIVDHTLAFARAVWTFLLPMLYFVGYPLSMVISANLAIYTCYMGMEFIYWCTSYILADSRVRKRLRKNWWLFTVMPLYRFILFWFRFGGFLSVLTEPADWKVKDPVAQIGDGFRRLKTGLSLYLKKGITSIINTFWF